MRSQPYAADVTRLARENGDFRRVLHTAERSRVGLMAVPAGREVGEETHGDIDQILAFKTRAEADAAEAEHHTH